MNTPTLETDRLTLRPMTLDDAADMHAIFSHPDAMRFMPTPPHDTVEQTRNNLQWDMSRNEAHMWAIRLKDSEQVIGQMHYLGETRVPGMGYIIHPDFWGQGITVEAARPVLDFGFTSLGYDLVELWIDAVNSASIRVAQKLGFTLRGSFQNKYQHKSTQFTVLVWGMLASEWDDTLTSKTKPEVEFFGVEPVLMVHDIVASTNYYRDVLGFNIDFLYGNPPTHAGVSRGKWSGAMVTIQLSQVPKDREIVPSASLFIRVDTRIDDLHAQYVANGATILEAPEDKPWGFREFAIKDMNGHVLRFATQV